MSNEIIVLVITLQTCHSMRMDIKPLIDALERRAFTARIPVSTLCKRAGISSATFSNWKAGVRPSAAKLGAVEKAMDEIERERRA